MQVSGESRGLGPDGAPKELPPAPVLCQMLELSMAALHRVDFPFQHFDDGLDKWSLSLSSQLCITLILGYGETLDTIRPLASHTNSLLPCFAISHRKYPTFESITFCLALVVTCNCCTRYPTSPLSKPLVVTSLVDYFTCSTL